MIPEFKKSLNFWSIPIFAFLIWYLKDVFFIIITGVIFGLAIQEWALFLKAKTKIPFYLNVSLIFLSFIFLFILSIYTLAPIIISELKSFIPNLADYLKSLGIKTFGKIVFQFLEKPTPEILMMTVSNFFNLLGGIFVVILVLIISFYIATQPKFFNKLFEFIFKEKASQNLKIFQKIKKKFAFWLISQIFLMISIGLATLILMLILKVPYAGIIALIAGLTEIIPIIGPIIGASVAILITFSYNPEFVLWVLIGFVIIQQLENNILVPLVARFAFQIPPIVTLSGILIGGKIGGILGIITIIPLTVLLVEIYQEIR